MFALGLIAGLLVAVVILLGVLYLHEVPEAKRELRKFLPKVKGGIVVPRSRAEMDRDQRVEEAKKRGEAIPIEDHLI